FQDSDSWENVNKITALICIFMLFRGLKAPGEKNGRPGLSSPAHQNTRNTEPPLRIFQQRSCISSIIL
ncbi:hypothetical protein, partial [Akkermansia sp.]|uniref:hypothetical protein n=1 Tax=Akkermansia sp. TaxID=1872421 RepID=UPI003AAB9C04